MQYNPEVYGTRVKFTRLIKCGNKYSSIYMIKDTSHPNYKNSSQTYFEIATFTYSKNHSAYYSCRYFLKALQLSDEQICFFDFFVVFDVKVKQIVRKFWNKFS